MSIKIIDMPKDEMHIQQAGEVIHLAFAKNYPDAWSTIEEGIEEVREMLDEAHICRAAMDGERVVGWIGGISEYDGNVWELHPLCVHPNYQGQGIGQMLVEDLERLVAAKGAMTIMLGSDDETGMTSLSDVDLYDNLWDKIKHIQNLKGHPYSFYQKLGFQIVGVIPDANGIGKPDILMSKRVAES